MDGRTSVASLAAESLTFAPLFGGVNPTSSEDVAGRLRKRPRRQFVQD
jgi:hypothetical protein